MNSENQSQVTHILHVVSMLQSIKSRLSMFVDPVGNGGQNFLHGFRTACAMLGIQPPSESLYQATVVERGWKWSSLAPVKEMGDAGLDAESIAHELIAIEIEVWKKHLDNYAKDNEMTSAG